MELRTDKVGTYAQHTSLVNQMLTVQKRMMETQTQLTTEKKSQTYSGIASDSFRLVSMENEISRLQMFQKTNSLAMGRLETMGAAVDSTDETIRDLRNMLLDFPLQNLSSPGLVGEWAWDGTQFTVPVADTPPVEGSFVRLVDGGNEFFATVDTVTADPPLPAPTVQYLVTLEEDPGLTAATNYKMFDASNVTAEQLSDIEHLQDFAFEAMKTLSFLLNSTHDGRYLFAGGRTDTQPVEFPFGSIDDFQAIYDGDTLRYPQSRSTHLDNTKVEGDLTFTDGVAPAPNTIVVAAPATFNDLAVDETTGGAGNLSVTHNSITAAVGTPFSGLQTGDVVRLETDNGGALAPPVHVFVTVKSVGGGGSTVTFTGDPGLNEEPDPANHPGVTFTNLSPLPDWTVTKPTFSPGQVEITDGGANSGTYTVTDISADGLTLTVLENPPLSGGTASGATVEPMIYYKGDELEYEHRLDDSRSITLGLNAKDPAFEKALRAMGMLAQGNLINNPERVFEAVALLNDALDHDPAMAAEMSSDLNNVARLIGVNQNTINDTMDDQKDYENFLMDGVADIENVDLTETATKLTDYANALEISYSAFARIMSLSLNNYL